MEEPEEYIVEKILSEWHPDFWQEVESSIRIMLMSRLEPGRLCFWNIHIQLTLGMKKLVLAAWRAAARPVPHVGEHEVFVRNGRLVIRAQDTIEAVERQCTLAVSGAVLQSMPFEALRHLPSLRDLLWTGGASEDAVFARRRRSNSLA